MFPLTDGLWDWPGVIFAAGLWLIVLAALVAGLIALAVVEVAERVRHHRDKCNSDDNVAR